MFLSHSIGKDYLGNSKISNINIPLNTKIYRFCYFSIYLFIFEESLAHLELHRLIIITKVLKLINIAGYNEH